jgi:hypothetical protein
MGDMKTVGYAKKGKTGASPGKGPGAGGRQAKSELLGSPYITRHTMGDDEKRARELYANDYGKKPAPEPGEIKGLPVSWRSTVIHGR